jgi:hypothetical protein
VGAERPADGLDRRDAAALELDQLGHVVGEPEADDRLRVEGQDHHRSARDPAQLAEALLRIRPLVHGQHGHGRVDRAIVERQRLGHGVDRRSQMEGESDGVQS